MIVKWIYISIGASILSFLLSYWLTRNLAISIIAAITVLVITIVNDPKRRYMKAFWGTFSLFIVLNRFFFEVTGKFADVNFTFASQKSDAILSVFLLLLSIVCLILDYKERNPEKQYFSLLSNRNEIRDSSSQKIINKGKVKKQINITKNKGKIEL